MRLSRILLLLSFAVTSTTSKPVYNRVEISKVLPQDQHSAFRESVGKKSRFLRPSDSKEAKNGSKFGGVDNLALKNEEERGITPTEAITKLGNSLMAKTELGTYLFLGFKPEKVLNLLKVVSREDEKYKQYATYFYQYYVKYLDEPLSHLPAKTVENIMQARLYHWLHSDLTPPQVLANLKRISTADSAHGLESGKYLKQFEDMWGSKQVRESKRAQYM